MIGARRWPIVLATVATTTALCLSVLAGWQRGGTWPERLVWIAIGMVLVTSAHLLPALIRNRPFLVRVIGSLLWIACLVTTCYGHATFFLLSQQHVGEQRVSSAVVVPSPPARSLTVVMTKRAAITQQLARIDVRRCVRDCALRESRRATLAARLDVLSAEADDVRRVDTERDRLMSRRDALRDDPVTSRLAALLGTTTEHVDMLSGLTFAAVLEGVACLLWTVVLGRSSIPEPTDAATTADAPTVPLQTEATSHAATTASETPVEQTVSRKSDNSVISRLDSVPANCELARLAQDVAAGLVRPTVADIRLHLGCSQARALTLRRRLAELNLPA